MTKEARIALLQGRRVILAGNGKDNANIIRKIDREIRNLSKK